jgi:hypothetical protein
MLLDEYAIIPDVFDPRSYSSPELAAAFITILRRPLTEDGIVANLRNGEWLDLINGRLPDYHQRAKGLIADLVKLKRVMPRPIAQAGTCETSLDWCKEAIASNMTEPLTGIVVPQALTGDIKWLKGPIEAIDRLSMTGWWRPGAFSLKSPRTIDAYVDVLHSALRHANSVMLIDPYLDPSEPRSAGVAQILGTMVGRAPSPLIEIHRVVSWGSGGDRKPRDKSFLEGRFAPLSHALSGMGLKAHVHIWDNFHDRFLLTNHVGVSMTNGFDSDGDPKASMVWNRMDRHSSDDVQREFDPGAGRHKQWFDFPIGLAT